MKDTGSSSSGSSSSDPTKPGSHVDIDAGAVRFH